MKIEVNNITLNYIKEGEGLPLILLHGNGEDHTIFDPLVGLLKNDFTIYAIDSRNHGASSKTDDYSYQSMAEDIFQFIKKLDLKDVSILGFSDGAIVATIVELDHLGLFYKIILLGVNFKPSDFKPEAMEWVRQEYEKTSNPLMKMMLEEPNIDINKVRQILCPTLVVRAEDEIFVDGVYDTMVDIMPKAELLIMEGYDHGSYIVGSTALYNDLKAFL